jgi:hypothetical protein
LNRRAVTGKPGRTSPVYRRNVPEKRSRGRTYVFVRAKRRQREKALPDMARRRKDSSPLPR